MIKTKVIKGRPNYVYRGGNYLEQPDKTLIKRMVYDEESNVTNVYCRRPGHKLEILCSIVVLLCVYINIAYVHKMEVKLYYNSIATYYDGALFINLSNDDSNIFNVRYALCYDDTEIVSGMLEPGDTVISIPVKDIKESYTLKLQHSTARGVQTDEVKINVIDRSN